MTAAAFDPEAIARRVFDREHAAVDEQRESPPPVVDTHYIAGTGQTRGRPLPTVAEGDGSDIFDRLERQRAAKQVRSPFGEHAVARHATDVAADPDRFVTPDLDVDEDIPVDIEPDIVLDNPEPYSASLQVSEPIPPAPVDTRKVTVKGDDAHNPRCGQPLTGGGAPLDWVLVRIVGHGAPRRWCTPECAINALTAHAKVTTPRATPERARHLEQRAATIRPRPRPTPARDPSAPRGRTTPYSAEERAELVRRYQAGETVPDLHASTGIGIATIRRYLKKAGAQRRDDRTTKSGSAPKDYDPQLVERVRALYESGLTQIEVGAQIGTSRKVVQNVMERHGIPRRAAGSRLEQSPGHGAGAAQAAVSARLRELNLTPRQVKEWAVEQGLIPAVVRGNPRRHLIDAYLAAHQNGAST